jgi:Ca-activated chloride channel family protein
MNHEERNPELHGFEPLRVAFAVLALLLAGITMARAETPKQGEIRVRATDGTTLAVPSLRTEVDYKISGLIAEVQVHQRFRNDGSAWLEGQYLLPLPEGAAVHDLTLHIGTRTIVGEVHEKEQARSEYAQAAANGQHASLVEADKGNLFRTAVANVAPGETVDVEIGYWQRVDYRDGVFSVNFPLTFTPRYSVGGGESGTGNTAAPATDVATSAAAPKVSIHAELDAGLALDKVDSPSHDIAIDRQGSLYRVRLQSEVVASDRDFVLTWTPKPTAAPSAALFTEHAGNDDYALMMLVPPTQEAATLPRELILVIDTSGSMEGGSITQARAALDLALSRLTPRDRFNVIEFNSVTHTLFDSPVPAQASDVQLAREWVAQLRADGGTEMAAALHAAFAGKAPEGFVRQVVFATDGAVENEEDLYKLIESEMGASRLFPIGIGSAPNGHFLTKAGQMGRGAEVVIRDLKDVGERMQTLFGKLDHPTLRDLAVTWPARSESYPQRLPDLYRGEPLLVVSKLEHLGGEMQAQGWLADKDWAQKLNIDGKAQAHGIARLWARRKIDDLEDALTRGADETKVREQILDVALTHHLVSRFTSLVAIDKTPLRPADVGLQSVQVANAAPAESLAFAQTATDARLLFAGGFFTLLLALGVLRTGPARKF